MGFDLKGFPELENALVRASDVLVEMMGSRNAKRLIEECCKPVIVDARARVKLHSKPHLRGAIKAYANVTPFGGVVAEMGVSYKRSKGARHAHLVENGHQNFNQHGGPYGEAAAHPFWEPALNSSREDVLENFVYVIGNTITSAYSK